MRLIDRKPLLKPKHIWAIRTRLLHEGCIRDLTLFNTAINSKLSGCDLVRLRVDDVHPGEVVRMLTTFVQRQTGRLVPFDLTKTTHEMLTAWLKLPELRGMTGMWLAVPELSSSRSGSSCFCATSDSMTRYCASESSPPPAIIAARRQIRHQTTKPQFQHRFGLVQTLDDSLRVVQLHIT